MLVYGIVIQIMSIILVVLLHFHMINLKELMDFQIIFWGWGGEDDELITRVKEVIKKLFEINIYICINKLSF